MRPSKAIIATCGLLGIAVFVTVAYIYRTAHAAYNEAIKTATSPLRPLRDSARIQQFLHQAQENAWEMRGGDDYGMSALLEQLALPPDLDGLISFYTFKPTGFSLLEVRRNELEASLAIIHNGLVPKSDDGILHISRDEKFAAIFVGDSIVSLDEIRGETIFQRLYIKKKEPNKAMQTTPVDVTDRADARSTPSTSVSDL